MGRRGAPFERTATRGRGGRFPCDRRVKIRAPHGGGRMFRKFVTAAVSRPAEMKI
jgi:hypothetical protein